MQASSFKDITFRATDLPLMEVVKDLKSGNDDLITVKPNRERNPDRWNVSPLAVIMDSSEDRLGLQRQNWKARHLYSCI
jgi:hypothetical protein